eukprot:Colp12_sorted_trinity150504_noHs@16058
MPNPPTLASSYAAADDDIFLGNLRPSLRKNPLLIKPKLGQSRPTIYDLPPLEHTYGRVLNRDCTLREVISEWQVVKRNPDDLPPVDFVSMNRNSVKNGLVTAREQAYFRADNTNIVRKKLGNHKKDSIVDAAPPEFPAGKPSRECSTPIDDILKNAYQVQFIEGLMKANQERKRIKAAIGKNRHETKSTLLKKMPVIPHPADQPPQHLNFTMSKFKNVPSRTNHGLKV